MSEAVLDAGPLIHLAELEALDTLMDFSALFVPLAVRQEVERYQPSALTHPDLMLSHVFAPLPSPSLLAMGRALSLDKGEMEALSMMDHHPNAILLTDVTSGPKVHNPGGLKMHTSTSLTSNLKGCGDVARRRVPHVKRSLQTGIEHQRDRPSNGLQSQDSKQIRER